MSENFQWSFFPLIEMLLFCSDSDILHESEITTFYYSGLKNDSICNLKCWVFITNWETMSEKTIIWIRREYENQIKYFQSQFWCSVTLSFVTLTEVKISSCNRKLLWIIFSLPLEGQLFHITYVSKMEGFKSILKLVVPPNEVTFSGFITLLHISAKPYWRFKRITQQVISFCTIWNAFCHFNTLQCFFVFCAVLHPVFTSQEWKWNELSENKFSIEKKWESFHQTLHRVDIYIGPVLQTCFNVIGEDGK